MKNKKAEPTLNNLEDVNAALLNIAALQLHAEKIENEMNQKILDVKKTYEPRIKELVNKIPEYENQLALYCETNKKEFASSRSKELTYGRIGFRTSKPSLKLINTKKYTWAWVTEKFSNLFGTKYVKTDLVLEKNKVLSDFEKGILDKEKLETAGVKVSQSENSFYEINWDTIKIEDQAARKA